MIQWVARWAATQAVNEYERRRILRKAAALVSGFQVDLARYGNEIARGMSRVNPPTVNIKVRDSASPTLAALRGALGNGSLASALNTAAWAAAQGSQQAINRAVDRPTAFTTRAVAVERATAYRPVATVGVQRLQVGYLQHLLGVAPPGPVRRSVPFPAGGVVRLNQFGNLQRGRLKTLLARPDVFYGTVKTTRGPVTGVWQRGARGARWGSQYTKRKGEFRRTRKAGAGRDLRLVAALEPQVRYRQRVDFHQEALRVAGPAMERAILAELGKALRRR